jgi:hypothetical protein
MQILPPMKKIFLLPFILLSLCGSSQKFSNINFDSLKISLSADTTLFPKLLQRMKNLDSTLSEEDYKLLYFGQVFSKTYDPYHSSKNKTVFVDAYRSKNYAEALTMTDAIIAETPFDLDLWYKRAVCFRETGNLLMKKRCFRVFNGLLDCIEHSGNGLKCESAFVVACRNDEYLIISDLEIEFTEEVQDGKCDILKLEKPTDETAKPKFSGKKIYFNNYWSLKKMDDLQKKK